MANDPYDTMWVERKTSLDDDYDLTEDMGLIDLSPDSFSVYSDYADYGDDGAIVLWIGHDLFELFFSEKYPKLPLVDVLAEFMTNQCKWNTDDGTPVIEDLRTVRDRLLQCVDAAFAKAQAKRIDFTRPEEPDGATE